MFQLETRPQTSKTWVVLAPILAVLATMVAGGALFAFLGKDPLQIIRMIFWDPVFGEFAFYYRGQLPYLFANDLRW